MSFSTRARRGYEALLRAESIFQKWGFTTFRTGCEHQCTPEELERLRGGFDQLAPDQLKARYSPDLLVVGQVEVKAVSELSRLSFSVRPWLLHRKSGVAYMFVDPNGEWLLVPASELRPARIFFADPGDREWLEQKLPGVELTQLEPGSCSGSGEPFAVVPREELGGDKFVSRSG